MAIHTHLVVVYNHDTKTLTFDGDGTREWIRTLFDPETTTWSDEVGDFIEVPVEVEAEATTALAKLGISVEETEWQSR